MHSYAGGSESPGEAAIGRLHELYPETARARVLHERKLRRKLHQTIRKVGDDIEAFRFNTAIAALMELVNELYTFAPPDRSPSLAVEGRGLGREGLNAPSPAVGE